MERVIAEIAAERRRQIEAERWTPEHDDQHDLGEMAFAAAAYAVNAANPNAQIDIRVGRRGEFFNGGWMGLARLCWPQAWDHSWWKPSTPRRDLVKAAALIVAEIERLDRANPEGREERSFSIPGGAGSDGQAAKVSASTGGKE